MLKKKTNKFIFCKHCKDYNLDNRKTVKSCIKCGKEINKFHFYEVTE